MAQVSGRSPREECSDVTDEKKDAIELSGDKYGLAETPFAGYSPPKDTEATPETAAPEKAAEEPEPAVLDETMPVESAEEAAETTAVEEPVEEIAVAAEEPEPPASAEEPEPAVAMEEPEPPVAVEEPEAPAAAEAEAPPVEEAPAEVPSRKEETGGQPDYSDTFRALSEGDVVGGVVVHVDREGVLVDVGAKSEGIIRPSELSRQAFQNPEDIVQVGDRIDVYVMRSENQDENIMLSKKRADFEIAWGRVEEAHRGGKVLSAMVTDRVKGGLVVDLGIRGFVPGSHVGSGKLKNLDKFVGQSIPLKVIEVDRDRRKVVLSHRLAVEEDRESQRARTLVELKEGEIRDGVVRRMTDYGAFIDLGGIDGLLHISEMSWTRINHPSQVLKIGDRIQVMVLRLNLEQGRVSLGLRQILPDPWMEVARRYRVGDLIHARVSRLVPFGAFVQLDGGVEGIIPNAELGIRRVSKPEDAVSVGQEVEARVVDVRVEERRMTLSIRNLQQQREREQVSTYASQSKAEQRTTMGDLVGEALNAARRSVTDKERQEEVEKEQEFEKPKPKKRPSKAERRALEEEPAVVEEAAPEPAAETVEQPASEVVEEPAAAAEADVEAPAPAEEPEELSAQEEAEPVVEPAEVESEASPVAEQVAAEPEPAEVSGEDKPKKSRKKK